MLAQISADQLTTKPTKRMKTETANPSARCLKLLLHMAESAAVFPTQCEQQQRRENRNEGQLRPKVYQGKPSAEVRRRT
jgi:hypothetical protein